MAEKDIWKYIQCTILNGNSKVKNIQQCREHTDTVLNMNQNHHLQ
jgi:hypothetical protein